MKLSITTGAYLRCVLICTAILMNFVTLKAQNIAKDSSDVFVAVEELPQFPGGVKAFSEYISSTIRYPQEAYKNKVEGRVNVIFIVEKDGSLSNVKAVGKFNPLLVDEAVRVVRSLPKWKPGRQNNKLVRVQYVVPIVFGLKS